MLLSTTSTDSDARIVEIPPDSEPWVLASITEPSVNVTRRPWT